MRTTITPRMSTALLLVACVSAGAGAGVWRAPSLHATGLGPVAAAARGEVVSGRDVRQSAMQDDLLHPRMRGGMLDTMVLEAPQAAQDPQAPPAVRPPAAQDGFVPMDEVADHDKLPAAPYLIGAYAVAWVAVLFYVWSLWTRLSRVEEELTRLSSGAARP